MIPKHLIESMEAIKAWCSEHGDCGECPLHTYGDEDNYGCKITNNEPRVWFVE